jgi:hypothetical protein
MDVFIICFRITDQMTEPYIDIALGIEINVYMEPRSSKMSDWNFTLFQKLKMQQKR